MSAIDREPYVGRSLKRTEDPKLITGRGRYVEDITLPGLRTSCFSEALMPTLASPRSGPTPPGRPLAWSAS